MLNPYHLIVNWLKNKIIAGIMIALVAGFFSCVNENILDLGSSGPDQPAKDFDTYFLALKLHIEDTEKTRDIFDSNTESEGMFNKGLPFERALYFPNNDAPGSDEDEDLSQEIYHFALLVDDNGNIVGDNILSLEPLEIPSNSEDNKTYTVYTKLYTAKDNIKIFDNFQGTVYVVLNASYKLVETVKANLTNSSTTISNITGLILSSETSDSNDFLYLKNKNGAYITDKDGNRYFTMSSSMIIDDKNNVVPAIEGAFVIKEEEEEAVNNPVNIYVERLQSKYTVLFKKDDHNFYYISSTGGVSGDENTTNSPYIPVRGLFIYPNETPKTIQYVTSYTRSASIDNRNDVIVKTTNEWRVNIVGWSVNGTEQKEYLFKNLTPNTNYTEKDWFNSSSNVRNFWSEDPNYDTKKGYYPDQYRPSDDPSVIVKNGTNKDPNQKTTLKYFSFNELSKRNLRNYTPENTFTAGLLGDDPISSKSHLRVGSHIIVTAQLIIPDEEDGENNFEHRGIASSTTVNNQGLLVNGSYGVKSKFLMNDIYWDELAYKDYVVEYLGYWMLTAENQKIFGKNDGYFYENQSGVKASGASFDVVEVNLKGTDNMVWLMPNKKLYIYIPEGDNKGYHELDPEKYEKLFFEHQNYFAQRLNEGRMYYAEPTYHDMTTGGYYHNKTEHIATGDFGTVRNNWYSYTIDYISAPGIPVSDPTQPIIPNNDPTVSGMGVSMKLIDWHREIINVDVGSQNRPGGSNSGSN